MSTLLRISAAVSLAWAVLLLFFYDEMLSPGPVLPTTRSLTNTLALSQLALAYCFWHAARAPAVHRVGVYTAILLMTLRMVNAVYEILVLVPPQQALFSLADLVLSVGLLVALLEALPRTFNPGTQNE